ncbi:MAG: CHASE2 domain-containing protein, partial [Pseudomonadota bacterium]
MGLLKRVDAARLVCLALLVGLVVFRLWDPAALELLRLKSFDVFQISHPRDGDNDNVVIVDVDETSLGELGQWPWPRSLIADLVDQLDQAGARAIAFDFLFGN